MKQIKQKLSQLKKWARKKRKAFLASHPHRSFRKTRTPFKKPALVGIKQNTVESFKTIWHEKRLFWRVALIYIIITYLFVGGVAQADFVELRNATLEVLGGSINSLGTAVSLLTSTMSGAFNGELSELQQFLSVLLAIYFWLTIVWLLRMRFADQKIKARDAIYSAGAPFAAYLVVGLYIILQLSPGAVGLFVFNAAQSGSFLHSGVEVMMFAAAAFLLCCLSIYWFATSFTALVVATLPQMYPWRALQIASELAVGRRVRMVGHVLALAAILFVTWVVCLLPALLLDSMLRLEWLPIIPTIVQILSAFTVIYLGTYVYRLYRSML